MPPPRGTPNFLEGPGDYDTTSVVHNDTYPAIDPTKANLKGKAVFISGASRGLGRAMSVAFAKSGASYIAIGARGDLSTTIKNTQEAAVAAGKPEPQILAVQVDVADRQSVDEAVAAVKNAFGRIDIVINNAGMLSTGSIADSDPEVWWRTMQVNLLGPYLLTRAFLPLMLEATHNDDDDSSHHHHHRTFVTVSSVAAHRTNPSFSAYQTSKLAVLRLTECVAAECGSQGVLAYTIHPGNIPTDILDDAGELTPKNRAVFVETPELSADSLVYLTSERRDWLAGRYINVTWDLPELMEKKEDIVKGDKLKIGVTHGRLAKQQVEGSIQFYSQLFEKSCSLNWHQVVEEASKYVEPLEKIAPRHVEEIRGIAKGAGRPFLDILALNVRTEINFGLFTDKAKNVDIPSDGCTSLGWLTQSTSFLAQNWDWQIAQRDNLIVCHISQPGTDIPRISQVTEGGIIGKIGLNSSGVGCLLNAIRCRGVEPTKLPIHFALRTILESGSRKEAIERIERVGVAGSGHILIGDPTGSTGLECTHKWVKELPTNEQGVLCHTNHLLLEHDDVEEPLWLEDSPSRLQRIQDLTSRIRDPTREGVFDLFTDEEGSPASINRKRSEERSVETLFNIVMDLTRKNATVTLGRPTEHAGQILLAF